MIEMLAFIVNVEAFRKKKKTETTQSLKYKNLSVTVGRLSLILKRLVNGKKISQVILYY